MEKGGGKSTAYTVGQTSVAQLGTPTEPWGVSPGRCLTQRSLPARPPARLHSLLGALQPH